MKNNKNLNVLSGFASPLVLMSLTYKNVSDCKKKIYNFPAVTKKQTLTVTEESSHGDKCNRRKKCEWNNSFGIPIPDLLESSFCMSTRGSGADPPGWDGAPSPCSRPPENRNM